MFSEKMKSLLRANSMHHSASSYAGRGVTTSDLNEKILFSIHKDIKETFGAPAATEFVTMVKDLDNLSASSFLQGLEIFEVSNYTWNKKFKEDAESFPADKDNSIGMQVGLLLVMNNPTTKEDVLEKSNRIKFHFLKTQLPKDEYRIWLERHAHKDIYGDYHISPFY